MKLRRLAPLLALALLAGCQSNVTQQPTGSPSLSPSPEPSAETAAQVTVHWDALSSQDESTAQVSYFYDSALTEFIPSDDYGQLVPYIGGEMEVVYYSYWDEDGEEHQELTTHYLYGLCTTDGRIVTGPIYRSVSETTWYDASSDDNGTVPVWQVTQVFQDEDGEYYNATGLVAQDGSWYTGMNYRAVISSSPYSMFMMESAQSAVLISVQDGGELVRYSPYDFLGDDPNGYAEWFFSSGMDWGMLRCYGDWYCYDPAWGGDSDGDPIWIDAATGQMLDEAPTDEDPEYSYDSSRNTFFGGWYDPSAYPLVLHYDDGTDETIDLSDDTLDFQSATVNFLLFYDLTANQNVLTDHQGNVLATGSLWFYADSASGQPYPYLTEFLGENYTDERITILDPTSGQPLVTMQNWDFPRDGLLLAVDDDSYRLVDLTDSGRDILRIPRWEALDWPADD